MPDPDQPIRKDEESTWLVEAVDKLHDVPGQPVSTDQLANLLNAQPDLQPTFDLEPDDDAGADDDEPPTGHDDPAS